MFKMETANLFYDSLEEEDSPELQPLRVSSTGSDVSLTVPLYSRETSKTEVLSQKAQYYSEKSRSKLTLPAHSQQAVRKSSTSCLDQLFLDSKTKKSYVDLFHAKIGYVQGSEATETTRAVCDDDSFKTARSSVPSDYSDAETSSPASFVSDTSFYTKFLENEKLLSDQTSSVSCRSGRSVISKVSMATTNSKQCDSAFTSDKSSISTSVLQNKSGKVSVRGKVDKVNLRVPTLGGLGPDREATKEKLDKLKKKQKYGQKVSNQNRIKIMEMKVMKNFKYELKKSNELNKCTKSVFNT